MLRRQTPGSYYASLVLIVATALVATPAMAAKTWKFGYTATTDREVHNGPAVQRYDTASVAFVNADEGGGIVRCDALLQWDENNNFKQLGASLNCVLVDSNINTAGGSYVYNGTASTPWVNPNAVARPGCLTGSTGNGCGTTLPNFWRVDEATGNIEFCALAPNSGSIYCARKTLPN